MLVREAASRGCVSQVYANPHAIVRDKDRHALAVDSKPTTIVPWSAWKACLSALSRFGGDQAMLTACSDVVVPAPASTLMETGLIV